MEADNKYFETGSNPYYLNLNNTAKDFSISESTNPQYGLLDTLSKFIIIENEYQVEPIQIEDELIFDQQVE
jgi:hypothetical protein